MKPKIAPLIRSRYFLVITLSFFGFMGPANSASSSDANWGQTIVSAPIAWQNGILGSGVLVAIVDSGIDLNNPQLKQRIYVNPSEVVNGIDDDNNGFIDDVNGWNFEGNNADVSDDTGHGTALAGVVGADANLGIVEGIAPAAQILPVKFMDRDGSGSISNAVAGMEYAAAQGAKIILAGWTSSQPSAELKAEIESLAIRGILVITMAGNEGVDLSQEPVYPAALRTSNLISVGASTARDYQAGFSNHGQLVDLVAPGSDILTTVPGSVSGGMMSGTSIAAAFVTGAAALVWSNQPSLSYVDVKKMILDGVDQGQFTVGTRGRLSVSKALGI